MSDQPQEAARSAGGGSLKAFGMTVTRVERRPPLKGADGRQAYIWFDDGTPEGYREAVRLSGCYIAASKDLTKEVLHATVLAFSRAGSFFGENIFTEPAGDANNVYLMVCEALEV